MRIAESFALDATTTYVSDVIAVRVNGFDTRTRRCEVTGRGFRLREESRIKESLMTKQQPIVDDADVQNIADLFLKTSSPTVSDGESDEELVKLAGKAALIYGCGTTAAWRRELVRKVEARVQFGLMARRRASRAADPSDDGT